MLVARNLVSKALVRDDVDFLGWIASLDAKPGEFLPQPSQQHHIHIDTFTTNTERTIRPMLIKL